MKSTSLELICSPPDLDTQGSLMAFMNDKMETTGLVVTPDYFNTQLLSEYHYGIMHAYEDHDRKGIAVVDYVQQESLWYVDKLAAQGQGTTLLIALAQMASEQNGYMALRTSSQKNVGFYDHVGTKLASHGLMTVKTQVTDQAGIPYTSFVYCSGQKPEIPLTIWQYIANKPKSVMSLSEAA